ncbi:MAG TPA: hypothetical protein VFX12_05325 [Vicinamibacterales bacterium]|nr:hypothetical protein [Vicinamibacterales bacterium]
MDRTWRTLTAGALAIGLSGIVLSAQRRGGAPEGPRAPEPLHFEWIGPASAGRIASVTGIPGDTHTYYAGAAAGGVWKSTDGARTFEPVFDKATSAAVGALAVAPSNPNIVWAGTGEAWAVRDSDLMGDGIYKSTDAGATWQHAGLTETGRIGRIIVNPTNPDIVFACALGRTTGPQQERGVFRTTDGGQKWERVLFVNPDTGCSGLAMDSKNPNVLLAGTWQVVMHTWAMFSGGPGSGVYRSTDGGATWQRLEKGLPKSPVGKIDVAIAPSNSSRMYALIQTANQGSLWRSDDGGANWRVVSWDRTLIGRAGYYIRVAVNPANADEVLVANSSFHRSTDGGLTFPITDRGCGDCHAIWMDPKNPDHWVTTGDGGMGITTDHARQFTRVALPIGQMYHVATDNRVPYWVYSNRQDDGTMRGPSDSPVPVPNVPSYAPEREAGGRGGRGGRGGGAAWEGPIGGCESGFTLPDVNDPDIVWASCYGNEVTRWDERTKTARSVSPWIHTLDSEPNKAKYRCHWTPPLAIDPFDTKTVYYGCQVIFKTSDEGQTWDVISPDLSTQDPSRIVSSGGVTADNLGQFYGEVVFAIAPSDIQRGLIWAGTNDGKIWYTKDAGKNWTDVSKNVTGMAPWGTVTKIEPSHFDPATAYVAVDFHLMDDREPYIYKTTDFGQTWTSISGGLPHHHPLAYVKAITENPNRRGMLFAGTGNGFFYSMDDGATWKQFKEGLPPTSVTWITVQKQYHDVVISTYGRGLYILRDITRLEQSDKVDPTAAAFLYDPRPGFREPRGGSAEFLFSLRAAPAGPVSFDILDANGAAIRHLTVPAQAGVNEATWDLRYDPPIQVELRTTPPDNPHIWEEPRFKGHETRPIDHWGIEGAKRAGPLALPGRYTVRMTAAGQTVTKPFDVVKDPDITASNDDLAASTAAQIRIRDAMNATATMANRIERMRKQVQDQLVAQHGHADLERALTDFGRKLRDVERPLLSDADMYSDDKWYVEQYHLYMNLIWLNGVVGSGAGDVAGGADHRPTAASLQVLDQLEGQLKDAQAAFATLVEQDVPAFNKAMAGKLPPIDPGASAGTHETR